MENPFLGDPINIEKERMAAAAEKVIASLQPLPLVVEKVEFKYDPSQRLNYRAEINIIFKNEPLLLEEEADAEDADVDAYYAFRQERNDFMDKLDLSLAANNLELGSTHFSGEDHEQFWVAELTMDGKTNWRRWLPHYEGYDEITQSILDDVAAKVGQQKGCDKYERFTMFLAEAVRKGCLTQDESNWISMDLNKVC